MVTPDRLPLSPEVLKVARENFGLFKDKITLNALIPVVKTIWDSNVIEESMKLSATIELLNIIQQHVSKNSSPQQ